MQLSLNFFIFFVWILKPEICAITTMLSKLTCDTMVNPFDLTTLLHNRLYECPEQTKGIDLHIPRGLMGNI